MVLVDYIGIFLHFRILDDLFVHWGHLKSYETVFCPVAFGL
jgi:hypothetical protein